MRLIKKDLAQKLGVSERALTSWQREGLPVLEHGRRGQPNCYDLGAVVRWLRATGRGQDMRAGRRPIDLHALERELGMVTPVQTPAPVPGVPFAALAGALALARWDWLELLKDEAAAARPLENPLFEIENFIWFLQVRLQQVMGPAGTGLEAHIESIARGYTSNPAGNALVKTLAEAVENARALVPAAVERFTAPEFSPLYGGDETHG